MVCYGLVTLRALPRASAKSASKFWQHRGQAEKHLQMVGGGVLCVEGGWGWGVLCMEGWVYDVGCAMCAGRVGVCAMCAGRVGVCAMCAGRVGVCAVWREVGV